MALKGGRVHSPSIISDIASLDGIEAMPALAPGMALFLDVDGTLLDFADRPDKVTVPNGLIVALARVERKLDGALALVSGRAVEELDRLFTPLHLRASGVHGAQMRFDPEESVRDSIGVSELPEGLWEELSQALLAFPGTLAENKGFSFAVHYRASPHSAASLRETLRSLIATERWRGIGILNAHYAFELKAPTFDKGRAIAWFMRAEPFHGRSPIFIGDDTTDEPGFAVVSERGGLAISVGGRRTGAAAAFDAPRDVREWLDRVSAPGDRA